MLIDITVVRKTCLNSILAGAMIAIGAATYLNCPNHIVGAFLFSIGLIVILEYRLSLYTGVVGYTTSAKQAPSLLLTFLCNSIGCLLVVPLVDAGQNITQWEAKLASPWYIVFVKAAVCGALIYICSDQHKAHSKYTSMITTLMAVSVFIICGAEHSIADICFMLVARSITMKSVAFILLVAAGNAAGSIVFAICTRKRRDA